LGLRALALRFTSPYHVGWRGAEKIIDSITLHRALIEAAYKLGVGHIVSKIERDLKLSSLLPSLKIGECYKPLIPIPPLPSRVKASKLRLSWLTLNAAKKILDLARDCGRVPMLDPVGSKIHVRCYSKVLGELCVDERVEAATICDESIGEGPLGAFFEKVAIYRNRIDRLSGAADLYAVTGFRSNADLILLYHISDDTLGNYIHGLLELQSHIGLGGHRSLGWGRYVMIEQDPRICDISRDSENLFLWKGPGFYILLGSYYYPTVEEVIDLSGSVINIKLILGRSGPPHAEHMLPYMGVIGTGSIVYLKKQMPPHIEELGCSDIPSRIVFNPLVLGGG